MHAPRALTRTLLQGQSAHCGGAGWGCSKAKGKQGKDGHLFATACCYQNELLRFQCSVWRTACWVFEGRACTRSGQLPRTMPWYSRHDSRCIGHHDTSCHGTLQVLSHSLDYLGALRWRVGQRMNVEPACVRMFYGGRELRGDGVPVQVGAKAADNWYQCLPRCCG